VTERTGLNRRGKSVLTISLAFWAFVVWSAIRVGGSVGLVITLVFSCGGAAMCFVFRTSLWSDRPRKQPKSLSVAAAIAASVVVPTSWFYNLVGAALFGTAVGFLVAASMLSPRLRDTG
jgi:predicted permease